MANVGIFFVVNGEVIFDAVPLEKGEPYGDAIGYSGHHDYWLALIPQSRTEHLFKSHDYDYFPRGRVVYFKNARHFRLYADRCLKKTEIQSVAAAFALAEFQLARDEHYQCANCNAEYIDF